MWHLQWSWSEGHIFLPSSFPLVVDYLSFAEYMESCRIFCALLRLTVLIGDSWSRDYFIRFMGLSLTWWMYIVHQFVVCLNVRNGCCLLCRGFGAAGKWPHCMGGILFFTTCSLQMNGKDQWFKSWTWEVTNLTSSWAGLSWMSPLCVYVGACVLLASGVVLPQIIWTFLFARFL